MVQSVELLLDDAGDRAVRTDWDRLEEIGLRTPARHRGDTTRPHITLAVANRFPDEVEDAIARLSPAFPLPLVVDGLLIFGVRHMVLARPVAPSGTLLQVQRAAIEAIAPAGPIQDMLSPDRWMPHVTLARAVESADLPRARRVLPDRRVVTAAIGLRRWDGDHRREWIITGGAP